MGSGAEWPPAQELERLFGIPTYQTDQEGRMLENKCLQLSPIPDILWCSPLAKPSWQLDPGGPLMYTQVGFAMDGEEWTGGRRDKWAIFTQQPSLILYSSPIVIPSGICQHSQEQLMLISSFYYPNILLNTCFPANSKNFPVDSLGYSKCIVIWSSNYFVFLLPMVVSLTSCSDCRSQACHKTICGFKEAILRALISAFESLEKSVGWSLYFLFPLYSPPCLQPSIQYSYIKC